MKNLFIISVLLLSINSFAQDASSYFPAQPGYTWNFKVAYLDSANNEVDSLSFFRVDSFAVVQDYNGKSADLILSKTGGSSFINSLPYIDTNYVSFVGSDALTFLQIDINSILSSSSRRKFTVQPEKISKASAIGEWVTFYKFASPENTSYNIFTIDTTVVVDSASFTGRLQINVMRLADQNIQNDAGSFNCKKFVTNNDVFLQFIGQYIKVFSIVDTVWIAPNQWIVQEIQPSVNLDLSGFNGPSIFIPGSKQTLINQIPTGINGSYTRVNKFQLYQNYPNPFNPSTIISYSLPENSNVELTIYDILGNKVTTLINKEQNAGNHEVEFNPSLIKGGMSSGVYFYTLKTGATLLTKKLVYLK